MINIQLTGMSFIKLHQHRIFFLRIIIFRKIKHPLIFLILIISPLYQFNCTPFIICLLRIRICHFNGIGEIGLTPPQIPKFRYILTIPNTILMIVRKTMYSIYIIPLHQFSQTAFHIKLIDTLIHRVFIPKANYDFFVFLKNILIYITRHFTNRFAMLATISFSQALRLTFSCQINLPPVICIVQKHIIPVSRPPCYSISGSRSRFIITFHEHWITDSIRYINNLTGSTIKLIPDLSNRIIHYCPLAIYRPFGSCTITTSDQPFCTCMHIH